MTTKRTNEEQAKAIERLREMLAPGDTVHTVLGHVSRSGMQREIHLYKLHAGDADYLSGYVSTALGLRLGKRGVVVGGCGMDMGFHLVYELGAKLFPDGFGCIGKGCPSNDHGNGDRDYTPHAGVGGIHAERAHWHKSSGYALRNRWL